MYSLLSQCSAPTNTIDIIGSSKQALSSSSTLLLSSSASQSRSSLEQSSSRGATAKVIINSQVTLQKSQNLQLNDCKPTTSGKQSTSPAVNSTYTIKNNNIDRKEESKFGPIISTIYKECEAKNSNILQKKLLDLDVGSSEKSCHKTAVATTVASSGDGQKISKDPAPNRPILQHHTLLAKNMSESFMNYATSLNSVSSTSPSSLSANSSFTTQPQLQYPQTSPAIVAASAASPASMAAAMFYQQQQAAVAAAGFDAAAAAAAAVAGNPSGHHQGPLAAAAATAALSNSVDTPRYPWMSITGMLQFFHNYVAYHFVKNDVRELLFWEAGGKTFIFLMHSCCDLRSTEH